MHLRLCTTCSHAQPEHHHSCDRFAAHQLLQQRERLTVGPLTWLTRPSSAVPGIKLPAGSGGHGAQKAMHCCSLLCTTGMPCHLPTGINVALFHCRSSVPYVLAPTAGSACSASGSF